MNIQDRHPDSYDDIMVEAVRLAPIGREVVIAFQIWDMDDFDAKTTVVFCTRDFCHAERVGTAEGLWVDTKVFGDDLYVLLNKAMHVYGAGAYGTPRAVYDTPIPAPKAFDGTPSELWAVGYGAARWDGTKWSSPVLGDNMLQSVHSFGERAYAVGDEGLFVELGAGEPRTLTSPSTRRLNRVHAQPDGVISLAGASAWQGPAEALVALTAPDTAHNFTDVCTFRGQRYWSAGGGTRGGLFVQEGNRLVPALETRCWHLSANDEFLYAAGERSVFRFDGNQWLQLYVDYDEPSQRWTLKAYDHTSAKP